MNKWINWKTLFRFEGSYRSKQALDAKVFRLMSFDQLSGVSQNLIDHLIAFSLRLWWRDKGLGESLSGARPIPKWILNWKEFFCACSTLQMALVLELFVCLRLFLNWPLIMCTKNISIGKLNVFVNVQLQVFIWKIMQYIARTYFYLYRPNVVSMTENLYQ